MKPIELSIIVPFIDETADLPGFWAELQTQQQIAFELLAVDGGSQDGGPDWLAEQLDTTEMPGAVLSTAAGRGKQMNTGAQMAVSNWLLFLHVDSRFADPLALRKALDMLQRTGSRNLAGHFSLSFRRTATEPSLGYYFYAWKARLDRSETIHGDQGFLLPRQLFERLGGFDEQLPVMEDTDFAERLRKIGCWQLLPAEISTSARRFEAEGLWQRQLLGALIMCFREVGWDEFFVASTGVYRQQANTDSLRIGPFFELISRLLAEKPRPRAWHLWWRSGIYVRGHAWQLLFAIDAWRAFRRGIPIGHGQAKVTRAFEPLFDLLTDNPVGRTVATFLLRGWFELTRFWLRNKEAEE